MPPEKRKHNLVNRNNGMSEDEAFKLMVRDEAEGPNHGQRTRDTYHLSDLFVHLLDDDHEEIQKTKNTLDRFFSIVFAHPYQTPLFDEYAMYLAFAAATRSADLSRQIGAVIARDNIILSTGANECPSKNGGTYWPKRGNDNRVVDEERGRDYKLGYDTNQVSKKKIIDDAVGDIRRALAQYDNEIIDEGDWVRVREALASSTIGDITEYGRPVHAEMDALLTCARENISCNGAHLYTTTFPCHNCAKHIVAAGIKRVVYVEPYPKSKALENHKDSICIGFYSTRPADNPKVYFEPFLGVGPRKFYDLFSMNQGSGFPLNRKQKMTGKILTRDESDGILRLPGMPWSYLQKEAIATDFLGKLLDGELGALDEKQE